jgi:hypothetical protein
MITNEGAVDRALRALLGITLIGLGTFVIRGGVGIIVAIAGAAPLLTAAVGWCPLYALIHWDTHCTHQ